MRENPWRYNEGQTNKYFNRRILIQQLIEAIIYATLLVYIVYYSTELEISSRGLIIYEEWSGNMILSIVVFTCNIRIIVISNQFSVFQGLLVFLGIFIYYLSYFLIGVTFENDAKGSISHQISTGIYWLLVHIPLSRYSSFVL